MPHRLFLNMGPVQRLGVAVVVSLGLHGLAVLNLQFGLGAGSTGRPYGDGQRPIRALLLPVGDVVSQVDATEGSRPLTGPATDKGGAATPASAPSQGSAAPASMPEGIARPHASGRLPLDLRSARQYYLPSRVEKAPYLVSRLEFEFPEGVSATDGTVLAEVLINEQGGVDGVVIENASPPGLFEAATIATLMRAKFSPGVLLFKPVPTRLAMEVRYRNSGDAGPQFSLMNTPR